MSKENINNLIGSCGFLIIAIIGTIILYLTISFQNIPFLNDSSWYYFIMIVIFAYAAWISFLSIDIMRLLINKKGIL